MARIKATPANTGPVAQIAVTGFGTGRPRFEARGDTTQGTLTGSYGFPGIFDEMLQQWPAARRQHEALKAEVSGIVVTTDRIGVTAEAPEGTEAPDVTAWNDACEALLLTERVKVESGDGYTAGFGAVLAEAVEAVTHGFALFDPWFDPAYPMTLEEGVLLASPLLRAAVIDWGLNIGPDKRRPTQIHYRAEMRGLATIEYDDLIHITHGGGPGQPAGQGILRAAVGPFQMWRESMISAGRSERVSHGIPIVTTPAGSSTEDAERTRSIVDDFVAGGLLGLNVPEGTVAAVQFPSGNAPDYNARQDKLERMIAELYGDTLAILGLRAHGSRAAASAMSADDAEVDRAKRDAFVARVYGKFAQYLAKVTGYTGPIRKARTLGETAVDVGTLTTSLAAAKTSGILANWTSKDEDSWRALVGIQSLEAAGVTQDVTAATAPLAVGSLQASVQILSALNPTDPNVAPIAPAAALELLVGAGIPGDAAKRMIDAQSAAGALRLANAPAVAPLTDAPKRPRIFGATARMADREPTDDESHRGCCGAHSARLADEEGFDVLTPSGRVWRSAVPVGEVEIDGRVYRPELSVTWADDEDARVQIDAELEAALAAIVAEHRAATLDVLEAGGFDSTRSQALWDEYRDRYAAAVEEYARKLGAAAEEQRRAEERRQAEDASPTTRRGLPASTAAAVLDTIEERIGASIDQAAEVIANRVQSQVEQGWTGGGASGAVAAAGRQTVRGLAKSAGAVGNQVEAAATVQQAATPSNGLVVIAVIRSTMRDQKVCDYCRQAEGGGTIGSKLTFRFPEDTAAWRAYSAAHGPPDPGCEGGADKCRCRWIVVMGRQR